MLRNFLISIVIATLTFFQGCEKTQVPLLINEVSSIKNEFFLNEVKKELVLTDETGENTIFLAIYSDDPLTIESFLNSHDLKLITTTNERSNEVFTSKNLMLDRSKKNMNNYDLEAKPKIYVEVVYANLKEGIEHYFLDVRSNNTKKSYVTGYPIGFITSNNFIGTVHLGWGSEYLVQFRYKSSWLSSWKTYSEAGGVNSWFVWASSSYYRSFTLSPSYKLQMVLYPDLYQSETNYRVAYNPTDMRGHSCTIGYYDGVNCNVPDTPPSGTTAFIYTYSEGQTYFMYSPVNGNQCPLEGSVFDGANCKYIQIDPLNPNDAFIYANDWYMRPDIIEDYE